MKHINLSGIGLESEQVGGEAVQEIEYAIYAKMNNFDWRGKADKAIYQLQSSVKGYTKGSQLRVRKAQELNPSNMQPTEAVQYILTGKRPDPDTGGLLEKNSASDAEMLQIFLAVAGEYMEKIRYELPSQNVPGGKPWQIDTFKDRDGNEVDYVKIDLEIPADADYQLDVNKLPFELEDVHITLKGKVLHGTQERIDWMFKNFFTKKLD